ncbi:MAG: HAMP domain-containing sensor histidine kinase [Anaerolineales bacterium]
MFSSIRTRLWLTYAFLIVTALLVVAVIFFIYLVNNPFIYRQTGAQLDAVQSILLANQAQWSNLPPDQLAAELKRQDKLFNMRLLVVSADRQVIADSRAGVSPSLETRRFFRLIRLNQTVLDGQNKPWLFAFQKLDNGNFLVTAVPRPAATLRNILTDDLLPPFLIGGGLALVLALFLAFWMARWVADPLQRIVNAAREFGQAGGAASPLPLQGPSEVRELVGAFNAMTARVESGRKSQRDFVANVSHELKTPLTSIQGFAQAILDGAAATPEAQKQSAQVIYNEASRMYRMVLGLLDLARLDAGIADLKRIPVDLTALLNSVGERFEMQARQAGVTLAVRAAGLPSITGDGDRLAQVFINLVDNALKYTPTGGRVELSAASMGDSVSVKVADTGAGIPPEALPHVFDRFYQVDPSRAGGVHHGVGLGLAIVREIVRAHGGKISVRSIVGVGSEFVVQLPLVNPDASTIVHRKK